MSEKNTDWPAFPITVRDYFAAKAMQGFLAAQSTEYIARSLKTVLDRQKMTAEDAISTLAYTYADAMLKAREK